MGELALCLEGISAAHRAARSKATDQQTRAGFEAKKKNAKLTVCGVHSVDYNTERNSSSLLMTCFRL